MPRLIAAADGSHVPIWVWGRQVPPGALEQLQQIASRPYVVEHVAAMPDLHVSRGVAVGTVFSTQHTVVPGALGGDLGCGMRAVRFQTPAAGLSTAVLRRILEAFTRAIPTGDAVHRGKGVPLPESLRAVAFSTSALQRAWERMAPRQLGTLGGGNHFLELERDGAGDLWIWVHSGSRGVGAAVGSHHQRAADGASGGLHEDSEAGKGCLLDIQGALAFARANREWLMARATEVLCELLGTVPSQDAAIDVHHNFVQPELYGGRRLLVHRKGAISAAAGTLALIPGSMGTASYLVRGLGEPRSFASASHGAGRVMTRTEARRNIRPERFEASMRRVVFDSGLRGLVEEAPAAYRDIGEVLEDEADLVEPLQRLTPIAVLKG